MAINKERKDKLVAQYKELIGQSNAIFVTEYAGLSVKDLQNLRKDVREANGAYYITKNTLLKLALRESDMPELADLLTGQVAAGFALEEAPTLAKALVNYAKSDEKLVLKGGLIGSDILSADQVKALAKLPSLDQLRGQILGLISAPAQNIVSILTNGARQVVNVVDAYAKSEETAAAA